MRPLPHRALPLLRAAILAAACAACTSRDTHAARDTHTGDSAAVPAADTAAPRTGLAPVARLTHVLAPEGSVYDSAGDQWFVGSVVGEPGKKDGDGFVSRVHGDGTMDSLHFIEGRHEGVQLDGPMGMAIVGDTLWVTDADAVRAFDRRTGKALASVSLASLGIGFLNDVAAGPDGALYVTDTDRNRIYRVAGRTASLAIADSALAGPNGIAWDGAHRRFVVVSFRGTTILGWSPGTKPVVLARGAGTFDGVAIRADGRIIASSWKDSTIAAYLPGDSTAKPEVLLRGLANVADIAWDAKRHRVSVPQMARNSVEFYELK